MNSRVAFWGMLVVFIVLLGALGYLMMQDSGPSTPEPAPVVAVTPDAAPEPKPEAAPDSEANASDSPSGAATTLRGGGSVSGIVVAADTGQPVPGLKVEIAEAETEVSETATTDDEGRFVVASLAPGDYLGQVVSDEYAMPAAAKFTVHDAVETKDVRLVVEQAAGISGRVYDEDTGAGIGGITVLASGVGHGTSAETRADGTYMIKGLAGGQYGVNLRWGSDFEYGVRYYPPRMVDVPAGGELTGIDFTLSKGLHIAGRVINQDGEPVGAAQVSTQTATDWSNRGRDQTDADGQFIVHGLSPAPEVKAHVNSEGYGFIESGPYDLTEGSLDGVEIVVASEATIEGIVVDQHGTPVPKSTVHILLMWDGGGRLSYREGADEAGAFRVTKLPAGICKLHPMPAGAQGGMPDDSVMQSFTVAAGEHVTGVRLVLDTSGLGSISGRITDDEGKPLRYASVNATGGPNMRSHSRAQAGEDGRYVLSGLAEGAYRLQVSAGSYASQTLEEVPTGSENIDFVLGKCGRISGTVVDARTHQPITHFEVATSYPRSQPNNYINFTAFNNEEGRFEAEAQGQGATQLFVRAVDYAVGTVTIGELAPGEVVDNVVVALEGAQPLHGVVVDAGGAPVLGAYILVDDAQASNPSQEALAQSALDGTFTLPSLSPGAHTIHAHHDDYVPSSVEVDTSRQSDVEIVMGQGGTIAGIVTLGNSGVAGARVNAHAMVGGGGPSKRAETDAEGRFLLEGLPPGMMSVTCNLEQEGTRRTQSVRAEVANGATTEVALGFSLEPSAVEGHVFMGDGSPAHANVQAVQGETGATAYEETDAEGYYRMTGLSAGATTVMAMIQFEGNPQPIMQTAQLELTEGETAYHDFNLAEAAAVTCNVSGAPADSPMASVVALRGVVDTSGLTHENYAGLTRDMAGVGVVMGGNGSTVIYGLTPGEYTLLAVARSSNPGPDPLVDAAITSVGITITPSQRDYEVDLVF